MQTCSVCNASSPDKSSHCANCNSNLRDLSSTAVALKRLQANPRVSAVRIAVTGDACPLCNESRGTFPKEAVPELPHEGCSNGTGCRCFYEPVLLDIYP